jgi:hypothetical protein
MTERVTVARLRRSFGIMRRVSRRADHLPGGVLPPTYESEFGARPAAARLAYVEAGEVGLYVIPGEGWVCLVGSDGITSNCWSLDTVLAGDASAAALCAPHLPPGMIELAGLVPDGVSRVTLRRPNGIEMVAPVRGNVFVANTTSASPLPRIVHWTRHGHRETHSSGLPADAVADCRSSGARQTERLQAAP